MILFKKSADALNKPSLRHLPDWVAVSVLAAIAVVYVFVGAAIVLAGAAMLVTP